MEKLDSLDKYLNKFNHGKDIAIEDLWCEMDNVWTSLKLDNSKAVSQQPNIENFYSHPVWILNGLFSSLDACSILHREKIADYILQLPNSSKFKIADIGGGSGVLAQAISSKLGIDSLVEIIEPYPTEYFLKHNHSFPRIVYKKNGELQNYDLVVIQDVLEHVDDPIDTAHKALLLLKNNGYAIIASCFHPVILCHLPSTFFLRHTFRHVFNTSGLIFCGSIPGVKHAFVFKKTGDVLIKDLRRRERIANVVGTLLNSLQKIKNKIW